MADQKHLDAHYTRMDKIFRLSLGEKGAYSCARFDGDFSMTTEAAQLKKYQFIIDNCNIKKGSKVLDMGCGWGGLALWMAEKYGCKVTGVNLAEGQVKYANQHIKNPNVEIIHMDYRDVPKLQRKFDKVISIGMMEHVGYKNHRVLMETVKKVLKPDGLFLLHHCAHDKSITTSNPWITKYIFPGAVIPSLVQIAKAAEGVFIMEDWHNIGSHYDPTLMAWHKNFEGAWPQFKDQYSEKFYRMFRYYLLICAGAFRARDIELWQMVFSTKGIVGGYESVR